MKKEVIPYIKIEAKNNYDFGFKFGSKLKERIQYRIAKNRELYKKRVVEPKEFSFYIKKAKNFLPTIKKTFPYSLEEMHGMSDGANVSFEELLVMMCEDEIFDFKIYPLHCTSTAVKTKNNRILIGHNEDWFLEYRKNGFVLVRGKIKNNKFLSLSYIGKLVGSDCGLNKYGIAYTDNSLVVNRLSYKVPRAFHLRALLEAKSPEEAVKILDTEGSTISSTLIVWSNRKIMDVEELWSHDEIYEGVNWLAHTNHPLERENQNIKNTPKESVIRYNKIKEILSKKKDYDEEILKKILKNHKAEICAHNRRYHPPSFTVTVASVIMNPKDKWLLLCDTNPCKGAYKKYYL